MRVELVVCICICIAAFQQLAAFKSKADIFELEATYARIFPATVGVGHIFAVQTLAWAYDKIKNDLNWELLSKNMTNVG
jgi:lysylphosphatidylglycerol synthetase-like protein (DUF2156 family)